VWQKLCTADVIAHGSFSEVKTSTRARTNVLVQHGCADIDEEVQAVGVCEHPVLAMWAVELPVWAITDPAARLFRKGPGKEARLSFMGHLLRENRSGLVVGTRLTPASGVAERAAATALAEAVPGRHRITVAADRA
jgi:hypothetical protein